jgi:hypothetical protein
MMHVRYAIAENSVDCQNENVSVDLFPIYQF